MGLIHAPLLVFLDEPTTGLDPQSRANLWEHIRGLRHELGTTIFLTTHYLDEADALCDRILIIDQGRIVASGTSDELKRQIDGDTVTLEVSSLDAVSRTLDAVGRLDRVSDVSADGLRISLRTPSSGRAFPLLIRDLDDQGVTLESIEVRRPTLDDVFLTLTGRTLRDDAA
jgi:ABC-2 type transport system ATP-binding protein